MIRNLSPYFFSLFILVTGCHRGPKSKQAVIPEPITAVTSRTNYATSKRQLAVFRQSLRSKWTKLSLNQQSNYFTQAISNYLFPSWYGTPWDFNGTTQQPPTGKIACGYFVTTVLQDANVPINRVKMAQCASSVMIQQLVQPNLIKRYSNVPTDRFINAILQQGPGLYLIGLDQHTGFLLHDGQAVFFVHASYIGKKVVTKELAAECPIIQQSKYRITGKISADKQVLANWIRTAALPQIPD